MKAALWYLVLNSTSTYAIVYGHPEPTKSECEAKLEMLSEERPGLDDAYCTNDLGKMAVYQASAKMQRDTEDR